MKSVFLLMAVMSCLGMFFAPESDSNEYEAQISFLSRQDEDTAIFIMEADGSMLTRLPDLGESTRNLAWSPDGRQIAYTADGAGNTEIYVLDVDCRQITTECLSNPTSISQTLSDDAEPSWSADGSKIAFRSGSNDSIWNIFIYDFEESRLSHLKSDFNDFAPTWSPDGTQLAIQTLRDGNWEIYLNNIDGSNPVRLTDNNSYDYRPKWSPDGSKILFESFRDGNWDIFVIDLSCNNSTSDCITNLTNHEASDGAATWSSDGSKIAFTSNRDGYFDIYTMNSDGHDVVRLTESENDEVEPSWRTYRETDG